VTPTSGGGGKHGIDAKLTKDRAGPANHEGAIKRSNNKEPRCNNDQRCCRDHG
jgi:hypothetical protein